MRVDPEMALRRGAKIVHEQGGDLPHDQIIAALTVATRLDTRRVADEDIPLGATRFGGRPDLPASLDWPRWEGFTQPDGPYAQDYKPAPLAFLAQLNLAEVPDGSGLLPETGWLCFFYEADQQPWGFDPRHPGSFQVIYFDGDPRTLVRRALPDGLGDYARFEPALVTSTLTATLPPSLSVRAVKLPDDADQAYDRLVTALANEDGVTHHRLLGWPNQVQRAMERECQLVSHGYFLGDANLRRDERVEQLEATASDWTLLLQVDTDEEGPGWIWGDVGYIYFWIRKQDLTARRFGQAWLILQCY